MGIRPGDVLADPLGATMRRLFDDVPRTLRSAVAYGIAALVLAAAAYVLIRVLALVTPLVLAVAATLLLAALLMPLVDVLGRARVPRGVGAFIAVLVLIGIVSLIAALFAMSLSREVDDLRAGLGSGMGRLRDWLVDGPLGLGPEQLARISAQAGDQLRAIGVRSLRGATTVLEVIAMAALSLVLLFFVLKDGPAMARWLIQGLPGHYRDRVRAASDSGWRTLQGFVRGTAVVAAVDATGIGIGLVILRVPLALPLTLVTFIASFVPLVGATVAGALAVIVALATKGPVTAMLVLAVVLLVQNLEGNLLEPLIMARAVRLHPAVILLAVAAGALVGGVGGALLATPLTAMTYQVVRTLRAHTPPKSSPTPTVDAG
jgi:putative heme transporter